LKLEKYQAKALWPMTVLAVFFLAAFVAESFRLPIAVANPGLFSAINLGLWLIFVADYLFMLYLAENRKEFFQSHYVKLKSSNQKNNHFYSLYILHFQVIIIYRYVVFHVMTIWIFLKSN
jgi:hypothetical protein